MDIGSLISNFGEYLLAIGLILMFYFVAPRWISKLLKQAAKEGLGGAVLDIFTGMYYTNPETGEEFELTPQESLLIFCRSVAEHGFAAAVQQGQQHLPTHLACLFSETATNKMAKAGNPIAQQWAEVPRGHRGAIKAGIKDVVQAVIPTAEPLEGMPKTAMMYGRVLSGLGVDVGGFINKAMGSMGVEAAEEAAVEGAAVVATQEAVVASLPGAGVPAGIR